jgi:hypothetical protein
MFLDTYKDANGIHNQCQSYIPLDTSAALLDSLNNDVSSVSIVFLVIGAAYLVFSLAYVIAGIILQKKARVQTPQALYPGPSDARRGSLNESGARRGSALSLKGVKTDARRGSALSLTSMGLQSAGLENEQFVYPTTQSASLKESKPYVNPGPMPRKTSVLDIQE